MLCSGRLLMIATSFGTRILHSLCHESVVDGNDVNVFYTLGLELIESLHVSWDVRITGSGEGSWKTDLQEIQVDQQIILIFYHVVRIHTTMFLPVRTKGLVSPGESSLTSKAGMMSPGLT